MGLPTVVVVSPPSTALARCRRTDDHLVVELVDLAGDDDVLGRVAASLPPGRSAVVEHWDGGPEVHDRLFAALADELRATGRRRATRTVDTVDADAEAAVLEAQGFVELRRDGVSVTWILDL